MFNAHATNIMSMDKNQALTKDTFISASAETVNSNGAKYMSTLKYGLSTEKYGLFEFTLADDFTKSSDTTVTLSFAIRQAAEDGTLSLRSFTTANGFDSSSITYGTAFADPHNLVVGAEELTIAIKQQTKAANNFQGTIYNLDITSLITGPGNYYFALTNSGTKVIDVFSTNVAGDLATNAPSIEISNYKTRGIAVTPSHLLLNHAGGSQARSALVTVTNEGTDVVEYRGQDSNKPEDANFLYEVYNKSLNSCSTGLMLAQGDSCNFILIQQVNQQTAGDVVRDIYRLKYRYPNAENEIKYYPVFIQDSADEAASDQAKRRVAPILLDFQVVDNDTTTPISGAPTAGEPYDITFTLDGYHEGYQAIVALFDCADTSDENCAAGYGSNIGSYYLADVGNVTGIGSYKSPANVTVDSNGYSVKADIDSMPTFNNTLVARVYYRAEVDSESNSKYVSAIATGGQGMVFADGLGRKLVVQY